MGDEAGDVPRCFWTELGCYPSGHSPELLLIIVEPRGYIGNNLYMHFPVELCPLSHFENPAEIPESRRSHIALSAEALEIYPEGIEIRSDFIQTLRCDKTIRYVVR